MKPLTLCLALSSLAAAACKVPVHDSFATPQDAVLTFQSRLARDDVAGEQGCFSQRFVEQYGTSLQIYATVRDRFLAPLGFFGRLLLCHNSLIDNLVGGEQGELHARLDYSLLGHAFEVVATREPSFVIPDPATGAPLPAAPLTRESARLFPAASAAETKLFVKIQVPAAMAQTIVRQGLTWAELRNGWKLEGVSPLEGTAGVKELPAAPAGETKLLAVEVLHVQVLSESFGAAQLRIELPLGEASDLVRALPDGSLVVGSPPAAGGAGVIIDRLRWTAKGSTNQ